MSNSAARYQAMVEFIGTFTTLSNAPPTSITELSDGVALFEALSEISPEYFDPTTIARSLPDNNWVLKQSNLRKLVRNYTDYMHHAVHKDADLSDMDTTAIARGGSASGSHHEEAIAVAVELVAAAAVTCPDKGIYVQRIMQMSAAAQLEMKRVLERSLMRLTDYTSSNDVDDDDDTDRQGEMDENELVFDNDDLMKQDSRGRGTMNDDDGGQLFSNHIKEDLERQLEELRRELAQFKSQAAGSAEDNQKAQYKLRAVIDDLQDRLARRQDDLLQLEQDLRTATTELDDTKAKLHDAEEQKAQLADDLDVANAKVQQLHKAEATVVAYKKRLESVGVISQQKNDLEDQAANYLAKIMELESENNKIPAMQKNMVELQEQVASLKKDVANRESTIKSIETELSDLKTRLTTSEAAKKMYEQELAELRVQQENGGNVAEDTVEALTLKESQSMEQREKTMRLEIENKKLKEQVEKLQKEVRDAAAEAAAAAQVKSVPVSESPTPMAVAVSADDNSGALRAEIDRLKEELALKEKENAKISSDKDKLEAYTKRTLAKFQDKYLVALQECKAKLKEKQDKIEALESRSASERTAQKREERLLSSTIYELGLAIMQNRLKSGPGGR